MSSSTTLPLNLRAGKRSLQGILGCELLGDWKWNEQCEKWTLHCRLSVEVPAGGSVPPTTDWYILAAQTYPWGYLKFHPAKTGGLAVTFPHQDYNGEGAPETAWREGDICVNTSVHTLDRHGFDTEPFETTRRLRWNVLRALEWLRAAHAGTLLQPGDAFELAAIPDVALSKVTVAFNEDADSYATWQAITEACGFVELAPLRADGGIFVVTGFHSLEGNSLLTVDWTNSAFPSTTSRDPGVWIRLNGPPVLVPWQTPRTWAEFREACNQQKLNLDERLQTVAQRFRDGAEHILLIGFPIPAVIGGPSVQMHWQPIMLPVLSHGNQAPAGFRPNKMGHWRRDRTEVLGRNVEVRWLKSQNWARQTLLARGRLRAPLADRHILLIGAGALGSAIAELLARGGSRHLVTSDGEKLEAGNLCRHTLTLADIGIPKASGLARRLREVSPHLEIEEILDKFPPKADKDRKRVEHCDLIIDCTGSDELLQELKRFPWSEPKQFVSVSLGFGGKRLFCFTANGQRFPVREFQQAIQPWLQREREEAHDFEFPREGIGCWHPVFPARADDIWLMASTAIKHVESVLATPDVSPNLNIFEQQYDGTKFIGVARVKLEGPHARELVPVA